MNLDAARLDDLLSEAVDLFAATLETVDTLIWDQLLIYAPADAIARAHDKRTAKGSSAS